MPVHAILIVFFRWLHVSSACLVVGGLFYMRFVAPAGRASVEPAAAQEAFLRMRRVFKMLVHTCILFLIISGTYNAVQYWPAYTAMGPALGHSLFGLHLLLALIAFGIAFWLLAGKQPPAGHRPWAAANVALLLLAILAASVTKYAREHAAPAGTVGTSAAPVTLAE